MIKEAYRSQLKELEEERVRVAAERDAVLVTIDERIKEVEEILSKRNFEEEGVLAEAKS